MVTVRNVLGCVVAASLLLSSMVVSASGKDPEDTLVMANFRDLRDLNPHLYGGELFAQNLLFEGLIFLNEEGEPEPWLAESWEVSPDGKVYTFKLREDVTFSDGVRFDAHAAKKNFDAVLDNGARHGWLESVRMMIDIEETGKQSVRVKDDFTLEIEFSAPYYPFIIELGVTRPFRMLSPACFKDGTTKNGVACLSGTGSYVLEMNRVDEYSEFVRNPNYWGESPSIGKIVAKVIPDNQARLMALDNGGIDLLYGLQLISPQAFKQFSEKKGFAGALSGPVSTRMLVLNTTSENLRDVRVRRALQHLTSKELISERIMLGLEAPALTLFSRSIPYADIDLEPYQYDQSAAEKLLDEAGWVKSGQVRSKDGKPLEITLTYDTNKVMERTIAQFLQSEWSKAGVKLNLVGEEEQAHRDRLMAGNFDISFNISWGTPYDPQSFLSGMLKPVYGDYAAQQGLEEKQRIDETILKAVAAVDEDERQAHYTYILETLHREAVYLPLTYERNRAIFNSRVGNVGFNPSQFEIPLQFMTLQ
ncbi:nickel ABC transporter substrate-binding protein [Desulfonatronum thiodismutans]|uniref:nickel ABC transporter substrate-binding protein n=1 Tax=Desulfonatronum thiodismutans TaxID=159290 RepID=UPI0004ABE5DE|nr:nickel ABC transporter substrate-binding protein [Desulfonatronum thiodismutans]